MTKASALTESRGHTPLLQQLASMGLTGNSTASAYNLAELLGGRINLADSISLAKALTSLDRVKFTGNVSLERPQKQYLNARAGMLRYVSKSFAPDSDAPAPLRLPAADEATLTDASEGAKPFLRFYSLHQSEMEHRTTVLRRSLRGTLGLEAASLARLATLDRIVDDTLGDYGRQVLGRIPALLADHFAELRDDFLASEPAHHSTGPDQWTQEGGWLNRFQQDMRQLLLAEVDFRLLPARALLDVIDSQEKP